MIHRIFVSIIVVVVSCCKICDSFVVKSYLPSTNSLQKKHQNNNVFRGLNTSKLNVVNNNRGIELSNVFYDDTDMAFSAWEWQNGLGAPAALIAGAVLVTLMETREDYAPKSTDSKWVRIGKLLYRFLLASSFGLEAV